LCYALVLIFSSILPELRGFLPCVVFFPLKRKKVYLDFYKVAFLVLNNIKRKKHFGFYTLRGIGATRH
jgi:hypothetical protein